VTILQGNGGASCGVKYSELHSLLSTFGAVTQLVLIGMSPFAVAEFDSEAAAELARAALDARISAALVTDVPRTLFIEYSHINASTFLQESQHALQLPNAYSLEQLSPQSVCTLEELPTKLSDALASIDEGPVPGLLMVPDFVTLAEETALIAVSRVRWERESAGYVMCAEHSSPYRPRLPALMCCPPACTVRRVSAIRRGEAA
jgi:hypothetical protein